MEDSQQPQDTMAMVGTLLVRTIDSQTMARARPLFTGQLGHGVRIVGASSDDAMERDLKESRWDAVLLHPAYCRAIGSERLHEVRGLVSELQGPECRVVDTVDDKELLPMLKGLF